MKGEERDAAAAPKPEYSPRTRVEPLLAGRFRCPGRLMLHLSSGSGIAEAGTDSRDKGGLQGQGQPTGSSGMLGGSGTRTPGWEDR